MEIKPILTEKEKYNLFMQKTKLQPPKPYKKLTKAEIKALTPQVGKKQKVNQLNINIGGGVEYAYSDTDSSKEESIMAAVTKSKIPQIPS